jgi:hypothetical protein
MPALHPGATKVAAWRAAGAPVAGFSALAQDRDVHDWLVATGWRSDGSSASTDLVMGVRVGRSGAEWAQGRAADAHDRAYELSRRLGGLSRAHRLVADRLYRDLLLQALEARLEGPMLNAGRARAHLRYAALRLGGWRSWRP